MRHGQTVANARRVVQGLRDFPLDATGRAQAAALGAWLADKGIDRVLSSPLQRASETAGIVTAGLGLPKPLLCEELREIDGDIKLAAITPKVYQVFEVLGFPALFDILDTTQAAVAKFADHTKREA